MQTIEMVSEDFLVHKGLQSGEEFEGNYSGVIGGEGSREGGREGGGEGGGEKEV